MAARRLLIIMLVLLGISSIIAVVVPEPSNRDSGSEQTTDAGATGDTGSTGTTGSTGATGAKGTTGETASPGEKDPGPVASEKVALGSKEPETVKAMPGTRLVLIVSSRRGAEVEIGGLGLAGFADRFAPAVFDVILPTDPGRYPVRSPGQKPAAFIVTS